MKIADKKQPGKVLSDETLRNISGGDEKNLDLFNCSRFTTKEDCFNHLGCRWLSKRVLVIMLLNSLIMN